MTLICISQLEELMRLDGMMEDSELREKQGL